MSTPAEAFQHLTRVFDSLDVPYAVAGSVASSSYGFSRTTMDIDLVVDLPMEKISTFIGLLGSGFYADADQIRSNFEVGRAANIIHIQTAWKIDLFPLGTDTYSRLEFGRRLQKAVRPDGVSLVECPVLSAEDTVLRKLEWYRAGGETSERQWNDVRGIRDVAGANLNTGYLRRWAPVLGVGDLLDRLLSESVDRS